MIIDRSHLTPLIEQVMKWDWGMPMRVAMKDGSTREGTLKHRNRYSFSLSDSLRTIAYRDVERIEPCD